MDDYDSVCLQTARDIVLSDSENVDKDLRAAATSFLAHTFLRGCEPEEEDNGDDLPQGEREHRFGPHDD